MLRAIAPLFTILAAITTVGATAVRLWWSKPKPLTKHGQPYEIDGQVITQEPKAPPWLRTASKYWLVVVAIAVGGAIVIGVVAAVFVMIDLST